MRGFIDCTGVSMFFIFLLSSVDFLLLKIHSSWHR